MAVGDPNELARIDQEICINKLKYQLGDLADGEMTAWEADDCPNGISEGFWRGAGDESARWTTDFEELETAGVALPAPETLDDEALAAKLWEVIEVLAKRRVFLYNTDHLSDRELYTHLWEDSLREIKKALPIDEYSAWHLDILGGCSETDIYLHHKYYADDDDRRHWLEEFPDAIMPDHEDPPYDRDRHLPKVNYGPA